MISPNPLSAQHHTHPQQLRGRKRWGDPKPMSKVSAAEDLVLCPRVFLPALTGCLRASLALPSAMGNLPGAPEQISTIQNPYDSEE